MPRADAGGPKARSGRQGGAKMGSRAEGLTRADERWQNRARGAGRAQRATDRSAGRAARRGRARAPSHHHRIASRSILGRAYTGAGAFRPRVRGGSPLFIGIAGHRSMQILRNRVSVLLNRHYSGGKSSQSIRKRRRIDRVGLRRISLG